jgi:Tol biopolymer transport system component
LFAPQGNGPLFQVSASGGAPTQATELEPGRSETAHRHPVFLPDGKHFLYLATGGSPENSSILVGALGSKAVRQLVRTMTKPGFAAPDRLLFLNERTLMAQRFDVARLELEGDAYPIAEEVGFNLINNAAGFTASENGIVAWRSAGQLGFESQLVWVDRSGKPEATLGARGPYRNPVLSPDQQRIAIEQEDVSNLGDIWMIDVSRGTKTRFTSDPRSDTDPIWSPDGTRIVFASSRGGAPNLYQKNAGGAGAEELLLKSDRVNIPEDWSRDGRFILFREIHPTTGSDIWVLPMAGDARPQPYLQTRFGEMQARVSPDGRWVAYVSDESGQTEVYVQSFPPSATKYQVSANGGLQPRWRADGKELFYLAGASVGPRTTVTAVDVSESSGALTIGAQRPLFETAVRSKVRDRNTWDTTPDGQRFLINASLQAESFQTRPITVVVNWMAAAEQKP